MRILLFGAAGLLGRSIAQAALRDEHHVTAFVRIPIQLDVRHERLTVIGGDVLDAASVAAVVRPLLWRAEYADKERQEAAVRASGLDWTIVRPGRLTDGLATGRYRAAERIKLGWRSGISRADVADLVVGELLKHGFSCRCPTLTTAS